MEINENEFSVRDVGELHPEEMEEVLNDFNKDVPEEERMVQTKKE
jgi:hypothetical protein